MSGKTSSTTTSGLLKPSLNLPQRSPSSSSRAQSKERHRRISLSGGIIHSNEANDNINASGNPNSITHNGNTTTTTSTSTSIPSPKAATISVNGSGNSTTCTPTIIKTAAPTNRNKSSSPVLRSASPHNRSVAITVTVSSTTRTATNTGPSCNNQTRSSSTISSTHLSPWPGPTTYTSNSNHKKNSATADSRLVVLGSPAVGKSALVVRLLTGRFIWEYDPTLEAAYRHHTTVDDDSAVMDILDTAGQSEGLVNEAHARWGDGFVLAFSLTDRRSFNVIKDIHEAVASARQTPNFSCIIIANKTDLGHLAEVSEDEASEVAGELGASLFLTSACDGGPSIHAAFSELHRDVIRRRWTRRRRSSAKTVIEGFYKMFSR